MALKPTIYKFQINLSDMDRNVYESLSLTVAQHPSESIERMMARVLAYCLNFSSELTFTKGVSATDEPDIWRHDLSGTLLEWIAIGEPSFERIKKASRQSSDVKIYSINTKSNIWWNQIKPQLSFENVEVSQISWPELQVLAASIDRTTDLSISISDGSLFVTTEQDNLTINCQPLQQ